MIAWNGMGLLEYAIFVFIESLGIGNEDARGAVVINI